MTIQMGCNKSQRGHFGASEKLLIKFLIQPFSIMVLKSQRKNPINSSSEKISSFFHLEVPKWRYSRHLYQRDALFWGSSTRTRLSTFSTTSNSQATHNFLRFGDDGWQRPHRLQPPRTTAIVECSPHR